MLLPRKRARVTSWAPLLVDFDLWAYADADAGLLLANGAALCGGLYSLRLASADMGRCPEAAALPFADATAETPQGGLFLALDVVVDNAADSWPVRLAPRPPLMADADAGRAYRLLLPAVVLDEDLGCYSTRAPLSMVDLSAAVVRPRGAELGLARARRVLFLLFSLLTIKLLLSTSASSR